jgi:hypothetical protein
VTAILDRILHLSHVVNIRGNSYRLKEKMRTGPGETERRKTPTREVNPHFPNREFQAHIPHDSQRTALHDPSHFNPFLTVYSHEAVLNSSFVYYFDTFTLHELCTMDMKNT